MKMLKKNRLWYSTLALVLMVVMTACGSTNNTGASSSPAATTPASSGGDTIKIGIIVAESGPASSLGKQEGEQARLLGKQLQGKTIGGKKIELVIKDYETNDTTAVVQAKKLISEDKVVAIVGGSQGSTSAAIGQVAKENKVPFIALASLLKDQLGDYVFSSVPNNEAFLQVAIDYLKKQNISNVAWANARDGYGQTGLPTFKEMAPSNGINIVANEDFDAAANDMTIQLTKIKPKNPGALIVWSRPPGSGILSQNFKNLGFNVPLILSNASAGQAFLDQVGADAEGTLVIGSKMEVADKLPDSDYKTRLQAFRDDFMKEYKVHPTQFAGFVDDGVHMVLKAVEEGHTTPQTVYEYLESIEYQGITGTYKMSKDNHNAIGSDGIIILRATKDAWVPTE